ncbi:MAG: riboflavin synthase subunit alpha [Rhodomicrobium sp.]|nr:MAG: riboflavin synthase subunit alpha [Rhodomicrobium sp.]
MFTGIITDVGTITAIDGGRLEIACHYKEESIELGASIACDGCCLTVIECHSLGAEETRFQVDVSPETKRVTTVGDWQKDQKINLERALKMGDEFGGHIVSGHVDGVAPIIAMETADNAIVYTIKAPDELARFIAEKGSITLNGTSLTVNQVNGAEFTVSIIPHTRLVTTWQFARVGTKMNIEVDLLARYAVRARECEK